MKPSACLAAFAAAILAAAPAFAPAQSFPSKQVRIVVPFPPGGPTDLIARAVGQKLQERWGQTVLVDNRPGGSTIIGTEAMLKAPPDGHTLLLVSNSLALNRFLVAKLPYDHERDIAPVILVARISNALVVHPAMPVRDLKEFIAYAKANPGKLTYGSAGIGSGPHLFTLLFEEMAGVKMTHVPYKGTSMAAVDLISGQINLLFDSLVSVIPNARAGKVRVIGLTSSRRAAAAPEFPTLQELGLNGYDATGWFGLATQTKVPAELISRLNAEIGEALRQPEVIERLVRIGSDVAGGTPEEFRALIRSETEKYGRVIRNANIRPE